MLEFAAVAKPQPMAALSRSPEPARTGVRFAFAVACGGELRLPRASLRFASCFRLALGLGVLWVGMWALCSAAQAQAELPDAADVDGGAPSQGGGGDTGVLEQVTPPADVAAADEPSGRADLAEVPGLALRWRAPAACPTVAQVRSELTRVLGTDPTDGPPLLATAHVTTRPRGFALKLETEYRGERGLRAMAADDCADLMRTVSLVLALMMGRTPQENGTGAIDAEPAQEEPEPEPAPAAVLPEPAVAVQPESEPESPVAPESRLQWSLNLALGVSPGLLPVSDLLGLAGLELRYGGWHLGLLAAYWPGGRDDSLAVVDTRFQAGAVQLAICRAGATPEFLLGICAHGFAGLLRVRATATADNVAPAAQVDAPLFAAGVGAFAEWPRSGEVRLSLHARGLLALGRPRFEVDGVGEAHRVPRFLPEVLLMATFLP